MITRFPPSPTGPLHIGNVRTALFNYLFAKKHGGQFIVRIEDTDKTRSKKEYEDDMLESLVWLGIKREGELWHQSERTEIYKKYLHKLIDDGKAYISHETEGENREVVRFKNPNKKVAFDDLIRGAVEFDTTELEDFIIARNIDDPVYHLAVVVDDAEAGVTHIIRGEDHISNTPRHILIQEALGFPRPIYAHLPLILASDKSKLSKRKHGEAVSLNYYRAKGYLPEAMVNYLALLGWNPGTEQEIFTMEELIGQFDLAKIQKGGAIFDEKKLQWVNKEHIKRLPPEEQRKLLVKSLEGEPYLVGEPELDLEKLPWKKVSKEETVVYLEKVLEIISSGNMSRVPLDIMRYAEREGKGNVLWPVRYALTGATASPDPFIILEILGKEKSLGRLEKAIMALKNAEIKDS
ncbi:MAG: Glutamate-tRNA ligase [Parcubacteria group bacterium GW2011_GWA2_50_10b]|nr:MAG: Glutamate-tRNA ligase [Parcubacteria group bacterium GW2011_GWA2_50_10b]